MILYMYMYILHHLFPKSIAQLVHRNGRYCTRERQLGLPCYSLVFKRKAKTKYNIEHG